MNSYQVKDFARQCGADLVGIADLAFLDGIQTEPVDLLKGYRRAVSIGVRLADGVLDPIEDRPTPIYQQHYLKTNLLLDDIALRVSQYIQARGSKTLPIPASQLLDKENWTSYISHKAVAIAAGLGWQGKSLLVISQDYGPRIRLVTILTDAAIKPDHPQKNRCGRCSLCSDACPVGAIKNVNTTSHYSSRDEALHFDRCLARVLENSSRPFIESPICGVCIRACPWGKTRKRKVKEFEQPLNFRS
ncbi:MAG: 4Fe-4S dicluster domain-containing protein [Syntrophaceae bacterium]|nr:4Fe-4S dicluster domain-containing protein [Syntrophaceae bacterium]